jgi:hypothetical protein
VGRVPLAAGAPRLQPASDRAGCATAVLGEEAAQEPFGHQLAESGSRGPGPSRAPANISARVRPDSRCTPPVISARAPWMKLREEKNPASASARNLSSEPSSASRSAPPSSVRGRSSRSPSRDCTLLSSRSRKPALAICPRTASGVISSLETMRAMLSASS